MQRSQRPKNLARTEKSMDENFRRTFTRFAETLSLRCQFQDIHPPSLLPPHLPLHTSRIHPASSVHCTSRRPSPRPSSVPPTVISSTSVPSPYLPLAFLHDRLLYPHRHHSTSIAPHHWTPIHWLSPMVHPLATAPAPAPTASMRTSLQQNVTSLLTTGRPSTGFRRWSIHSPPPPLRLRLRG